MNPFVTTEPAPGSRLLIIEQAFELTGSKAYQRHDGSTGIMLHWRTHCADCGTEFRTSSAVGGNAPTRRCKAHRAPGKQVRRGLKHRLNVVVLPPEVTL
jgi:hypothetical protein